MYRRLCSLIPQQFAPLENLQGSPSTPDRRAIRAVINEVYDRNIYSNWADEYYDYTGFYNCGYWLSATRNQREASENLVDVLLDSIPNKAGNILDVACGTGASTRRLLRYYRPSDIIGINISEKQLATCRQRVPGVRFLCLDAADIRFPDESIDNILCVQAVFLFDTREQFLREAYRVLKPGGCLALSDILMQSRQLASLMGWIPLANMVRDIQQYRSLYKRCGFDDVQIIEARAQCWEAFRHRSLAFLCCKAVKGELSWAVLTQIAKAWRLADWMFSNYLLVSANKPHRYRRHRVEYIRKARSPMIPHRDTRDDYD
jgi:ubiquinone/menaquinone biosynthesis C-methylase UbiE